MQTITKNLLFFFLILFLLGGIFSLYNQPEVRPQTVPLNEVVAHIDKGDVKKVEVSGDRIEVTLHNDEHLIALKEPNDSLVAILNDYGVSGETIKALPMEVKTTPVAILLLQAVLPFLIPLLLIVGFIWFASRQMQGINNRALSFGQSKARESKPQALKDRITFQDVAGVQEAKDELQEVVEFLKNPKRFTSLGAKIPKGVLLVGPPGTGKTLLSRAVAGEANVQFFSISGSEFVEMFVGVGASRVRDLFRRAKKAAPCIVFVDELDAVGRQRGAGLGGSHDEREQTLNQILVEMDGFETNTHVIVMAATNRPDVLDPALLRPGRFDRRVVIDQPDLKDRIAILKIHARGKPLDETVHMRRVAERTPGFSGADLANLMNEAAILTARRNKKKIGLQECFDSIEKVMLGPERKSHVLSESEKRVTAYHEAGHAVIAHELPHTDPVHKISIISRGPAAGYTLKLPTEDRHQHSKKEFLDDLAVLVAGHAAEQEIFGDVTTGASNDLREATKLARRLVTDYGMSEKLGPRTYGGREELIFLGREIKEERDYSERVAESIDREVSRFIQGAYRTAKQIIARMRPTLDTLVTKLMERETIEKDEFEALFEKHFPKCTPATQKA